jgi:hypothetical protein
MEDKDKKISLGFAEEKVPAGSHICYIFNDESERHKIMAKYLQSGFLAGEKLLYVFDTISKEELKATLEELGVDLSVPRQIDLKDVHTIYYPHGSFSSSDMLEAIKQYYLQALKDGYAGARGTGEMSWALRGYPGSERVIEYEARLTSLLRQYPYTAICQYDARLFDGATIFDVLMVHPLMIVRGQLVSNPYFIEPDEYLRTLTP